MSPPPLKVSWDAEIELELKRKKEAKRKTNNSPSAVELPPSRSRPTESPPTASPSSSVKEIAPLPADTSAPVKVSSAAQDLLGLGKILVNNLKKKYIIIKLYNKQTFYYIIDLFGTDWI